MKQLSPSRIRPLCQTTPCANHDRSSARSRQKYLFTDQVDQLVGGFVLGNRFQLLERASEGVRWLSCAGLSWVLVEDRLEGRDEQVSVRV
jgi:hypothetical protein